MSYFDPHGLNRQYSRRTQRKGQILQTRLLDPPLTIDNHLVPVYLRYIIKNNLYPNPLPIKLSSCNFTVPQTTVDINFTIEDILTTWDTNTMYHSGQFWSMTGSTSQSLYSFMLGFIPLSTGFVFYVSGTIGDNSAISSCPVTFRLPYYFSDTAPTLYFKEIAQTPGSTSPYFGYLSLDIGSQFIVFSGRQHYYSGDTAVGRRNIYPSPQFLPSSLFTIQ